MHHIAIETNVRQARVDSTLCRALIEAAHILTEEEFDVTLPSLPFQWSGGLADVFRRVVKHMEVR
jgi:hypothetical protein